MRFREIISELSPVRSIKQPNISTLDGLNAFMERHGFHLLGGGEFSMVFENPKFDYVVKVFDDECYEGFIDLARSTNHSCFPRFRGPSVEVADYEIGDRRIYARMVRMERLQPSNYFEQANFGIKRLMDIARNDDPEMIWSLNPQQEEFVEALKLIYNNISDGCWVDINQNNIMRRDNQMVIVDPFAPYRNGWKTTHK